MIASVFSPVVWIPGVIVRDDRGEVVRDKLGEPVRGEATPAPPLLTLGETARLLRIDHLDDPYQVLKRYRESGAGKGSEPRLCATPVGRDVRYSLVEVMRFIERQTEGRGR